MIDSAVDQYAIENNKLTGTTIPVAAWTQYVKKDTALYTTGKDLFDGDYGDSNRGHVADCPDQHLRHPLGCRGLAVLLAVPDAVIQPDGN